MREGISLSVVCATYNVEGCLGELLDSYRENKQNGTQLVIIDGGSTDGTCQIIDKNIDIIDVAISEKDYGIYDAWNKALQYCLGEFVSFIGADDLIADGALSALLSEIKNISEERINMIAGYNIKTRGRVPVALLGRPMNINNIFWQMSISHVMSSHRLSWLKGVGGFNITYGSAGDYDLILRERSSLRILSLDKILAYVEDGGLSTIGWKVYIDHFRCRMDNGAPFLLAAYFLCRGLLSFVRKRYI
ncbi:glycosyltransferase [Polynucleobacter paneuropaeus]|nr:glycosyltransferase [Polynucleobacter paneuropaeus]